MKKMISCSHLDVKCAINDPVDVRCGGPQYVGFDFYVEESKTPAMTKYIEGALKELSVPLIEIENKGLIDIEESKVWTEERIFDEISDNASYMIHEANRHYKLYQK